MGLNAPPSGPNDQLARQIAQVAHVTRQSIENIKRTINRITQQSIANSALGHLPTAFASLPAATTSVGLEYYCSNCRKTGEGPGAGTGLMVYTDSTNTWLNVYNNNAAAA